MLRVLVAKDLRRAWRNPVPYLVHLCLPLVITGLLGMIFGGANRPEGGGLGRIQVAIVDEDDSAVTRLLRGVLNQEQVTRHIEARFLPRDAALRQVTNNMIAAALILPADFTRQYLLGEGRVTLEVVKNPAQQFYPAIIEEAAAVVVTALNAVARNFHPDLAAWRALFAGDRRPGFQEVGDLVTQTGERIEIARHRLDPIPVVYDRETKEEAAKAGSGSRSGPGFNMFAYLLPGLTAMFLLFLADVAMRDLHREIRLRTFDRLCTFPTGMFTFVASKVAFTWVILVIGCAVLLGGGGLIFGIRWRDPVAVVALALSLSFFSGGLMAALNALIGAEKRADMINSLVGMGLGLAGGCAFPAESLPLFLRNHITPLLPPNWFVEAIRTSQFDGYSGGAWPAHAARMLCLGLILTGLAAWRLRRSLEKGTRA